MQIEIDGKTKLVGVIGDPVEHSCSPPMHNAVFNELGMNYVYVPFHVKSENMQAALEGFKALNVVGINITIPHKQAVIPFLDEISKEAEMIGAVNTLVFEGDRVIGHNTDARGFIEAMYEVVDEKHVLSEVEGIEGSAVVLGAGGASRAVVVGLVNAGFSPITIANRTVSKAISLAEQIGSKSSAEGPRTRLLGMGLDDEKLPDAIADASLLVNTTSAGMDASLPLIIDADWLHQDLIVYDIIYTPPKTKLLTVARKKGLQTIRGLGMLVHQGAIAFELWTGVSPPVETMRKALIKALEG